MGGGRRRRVRVCAREGGGACARPQPLSSCHSRFSFCRTEPGEASRPPSSLPLASAALRAPAGPASAQRPRVLPAPSRPVSLVLFRAGCARRREHSSRLQANSGFRHLSVTVHFPEGSPSRPAAVFRSPSAKESALTAAFALARRICFPPRSPAAPGSLPGAGRVPEARPPPPPFEVCLPPLPGWGKCASGRPVAGPSSACGAGRASGRLLWADLMGSSDSPEI